MAEAVYLVENPRLMCERVVQCKDTARRRYRYDAPLGLASKKGKS